MLPGRQQLLLLYSEICDNVDPVQVVPHLVSNGVLDLLDVETINSCTKRQDKVATMLDVLYRTDPLFMPMKYFKESLGKKYPSIADKFTESELASSRSPVLGESVKHVDTQTNVRLESCTTTNTPDHKEKGLQMSSCVCTRRCLDYIEKPMNSITLIDPAFTAISEKLFVTSLQGDWQGLDSQINTLICDQRAEVSNFVKLKKVLRGLLTRPSDQYLHDLTRLCHEVVVEAANTNCPTFFLAGAFTLKAWCVVETGHKLHSMGMDHATTGCYKDTIHLLETAESYLQTLAPNHDTCLFAMIMATVYLLAYNLFEEPGLTDDTAHKVRRLNALAMDHIIVAGENGTTICDDLKRHCRTHLCSSLLNFPVNSTQVGKALPQNLTAPSKEKVLAAKNLLRLIQEDFGRMQRRSKAYYYLLSSAFHSYSGKLAMAKEELGHALRVMDTIEGSGVREAATTRLWVKDLDKRVASQTKL